jgi:hypothetical protein
MMVACECTYFILLTPFQCAGLFIGHPKIVLALDLLDFVAAMVILIDLMIDTVQTNCKFQNEQKTDFVHTRSDSDDERDQ